VISPLLANRYRQLAGQPRAAVRISRMSAGDEPARPLAAGHEPHQPAAGGAGAGLYALGV